MALSHPYTAKTVAETFIAGVVKLHGMPQSIVSDRDPVFISHFWREFFKLSGTKLRMSFAYHPQTDGQTEVVNRCIEQYLRCFACQRPRKWCSFLPWAEYWYNTTYHASTKMTPFQALYGRPPPTIPHYREGCCPVQEVDKQLASRDAILQLLKDNLNSANNRMKQHVDSKRRDIEFQVGEMVFLKLHPYQQKTVFKRVYQKLASKFYGPFEVVEKIGSVAYKLKLPDTSRIHPVFHVSLLKKQIGDNVVASTDLPSFADEGDAIIEPEAILETRWVKHGSKFIEESLVQWKHLPRDDATWEKTQDLRDKFLTINLEDKVPVAGGNIDKPTYLQPRRSTRMTVPNPKYLN